LKKAVFAIGMLFLLFLGLVSSEISINQANNNYIGSSHSFVVNTLPSSGVPAYNGQQQHPGIVIEPLNAARIIAPCEQANFSFKITNQKPVQKIYSFALVDFSGTAFISPNLLLNPKEAKIVDLVLVPECTSTTVLNPQVHIETDEEEAYLPLIININGTYIDSDNCYYYYNETICNSAYYLKMGKDKTYSIDLSMWFYDPDSDYLQYSNTKSPFLDVEINKENANIKSRDGFVGTEKVVFYATDGKGGLAESKTFYVHVISQGSSFWEQFLGFLGI